MLMIAPDITRTRAPASYKTSVGLLRQGLATAMPVSWVSEHVPMARPQNRLSYSDPRTTMKYTHTISEDGQKIATHLGELLASSPLVTTMLAGNA